MQAKWNTTFCASQFWTTGANVRYQEVTCSLLIKLAIEECSAPEILDLHHSRKKSPFVCLTCIWFHSGPLVCYKGTLAVWIYSDHTLIIYMLIWRSHFSAIITSTFLERLCSRFCPLSNKSINETRHWCRVTVSVSVYPTGFHCAWGQGSVQDAWPPPVAALDKDVFLCAQRNCHGETCLGPLFSAKGYSPFWTITWNSMFSTLPKG